MERRDFVAAMSVFVGASFAGRQAIQIITPGEALWVPLEGKFTGAEFDGVLKQIYVEPIMRRMSAEQVIVNDLFSQVVDRITGDRDAFFRLERSVPIPFKTHFGPRKLGKPEIVVKNRAGVRIESRPA